MPRPAISTSQWPHPSNIEAYILHLAQRLGIDQTPDCSRTMLVQVWQGDNCSMEFQVVKCGTLAQTNGCPLAGAKGPILNKVNPLAAPFAATASQPPAPPMSRSHGPSASVIVTIIAVVILATTVVLLFLWDYQKRERARQVLHDSRGN